MRATRRFHDFIVPDGSTLTLTIDPGDGSGQSLIDILSTRGAADESAVLDGVEEQTPDDFTATAVKVLTAGYLIQVTTTVLPNAAVEATARVTKPDGSQHSNPITWPFDGGANGQTFLWGLFIKLEGGAP